MGKALATEMADPELSYLLLLMHGAQWIMGVRDDPYALLLRAASDDPHDLGRRMRARGPLYRSQASVWVTAHHDLAATALADARLSPEYAAPQEPDEARAEQERILPFDLPRMEQLLPLDQASLTLGRPTCERLRTLTRAVLDDLDGLAANLCAQRLRTLDGDFDLRDDLARPVAMEAVAEVLGPHAPDRFAALCAGTDDALDATLCPPLLASARRLTTAITGLRELLDDTLRLKTGRLSDAGAEHPLDDTLATGVSLAVIGVDMTVNLVCDALQALLDQPEAWERVRDDPACAALAIDETRRYAPPVRLHRLFAHEDVELAGHKLRIGDELSVVVEAAERDPAVHEDPDRFDLDRDRAVLPDGPLTAPAAPAARRLAAATLRTIAVELPRVRRTGPVLRRPRSPVTRGVLRFPAATG
ncbi:cytochrome P450 [Actinomadura fulvescens]|uniref:Cytochrome P450 n=2 Tax=Actinomadura fulvescens TaxID=46160 RepID=A0ABN3Q8P2_9ACTN